MEPVGQAVPAMPAPLIATFMLFRFRNTRENLRVQQAFNRNTDPVRPAIKFMLQFKERLLQKKCVEEGLASVAIIGHERRLIGTR